jgi:Ni/Co efflux regulator RcnB
VEQQRPAPGRWHPGQQPGWQGGDRGPGRPGWNDNRGPDRPGGWNGNGGPGRPGWNDNRGPGWNGNGRPGWNGNGGPGWNGNGRPGWNGNGRPGWNDNRGPWRNDWRQDRRYDWRGWRDDHRDLFRGPRYFAPLPSYRYNRLSIGIYLGAPFYSQQYWIADPWAYRLPPAYPPYRWVRYYDDVLLIDTYTGQVADVIYDFFW